MTTDKFVKIVKEFPIPRKWPISVVSGIFVICSFWTFTIISYIYFPGFYTPITYWMSDLGHVGLNPIGAIFFNLGCIITGFALIPFFLGLYEWYIGDRRNKNLTILTQVTGIFSAISMIMIGVFPEDNLVVHVFWALILFTLTIFTFIFPSLALYKYKFTRNIAKYGFIAAGVNLVLMVFIFPILEWLTIFLSFGFIAIIIHSMYKRIDRLRFIRKNLAQNQKSKKKK